MSTKDKIRIFAEYLFCEVTKDGKSDTLTPGNLEEKVEEGWKLVLKDPYSIDDDELLGEIAEELRYTRKLHPNVGRVAVLEGISSNSRNRKTVDTMMINYSYQDEDGYHGDWVPITASKLFPKIKAAGYDFGSFWANELDARGYRKYKSLKEEGLAVYK